MLLVRVDLLDIPSRCTLDLQLLLVEVHRLDRIAKELTDIFQRPTLGLGEPEEDRDTDDRGDGDEDDVIPPPDGGEGGRSRLEKDDGGHEQTRDADGQALGADGSGEDLAGVDVGRGVAAGREEGDVQEQEKDGGGRESPVAGLVEEVDGDALADQSHHAARVAKHEHARASDPVDEERVEQVPEGTDRDPATLDEELLDRVVAQRRVQTGSVVVDHQSS